MFHSSRFVGDGETVDADWLLTDHLSESLVSPAPSYSFAGNTLRSYASVSQGSRPARVTEYKARIAMPS